MMSDHMSDLGEKRFIADLLPRLNVDSRFVNGFGNDAGILDLGIGKELLAMNIDRVSRPIAAERRWTSYKMWGRLAVTVACSDLLAVGAAPRALMISIAVPGEWRASDVRDIVVGCQEECERHDVAFIGGDTKEDPNAQVVASAVGLVGASAYVDRSGAEAGCVALIAGTVGGFLGSYFQLMDSQSQDQANREEWIRYIAEPLAQWGMIGSISRQLGVVASMDLSDGLYEAVDVMIRKGLGFDLYLDSLPYHSAAIGCSEALNIPLSNLAFGIGDWGILLAVKPDCVESVMASVSDDVLLSPIGRFTASGGIRALDGEGRSYAVRPFRNESFRRRLEDETDYMDQALTDRLVVPVSDGAVG
jgi:thiamine-monophosphate kinase